MSGLAILPDQYSESVTLNNSQESEDSSDSILEDAISGKQPLLLGKVKKNIKNQIDQKMNKTTNYKDNSEIMGPNHEQGVLNAVETSEQTLAGIKAKRAQLQRMSTSTKEFQARASMSIVDSPKGSESSNE